MTHDDVLAYVETLEPDAKSIFASAQTVFYAKADCDTLCEEFQIAASVLKIFDDRVKEKLEWRKESK